MISLEKKKMVTVAFWTSILNIYLSFSSWPHPVNDELSKSVNIDLTDLVSSVNRLNLWHLKKICLFRSKADVNR